MAKSVLERVKAFRQRLKNLPSKRAQYRLNDKLAHREQRKLKRLTADEKAEERANCRKRVQLCRQRKKLQAQQNVIEEDDLSAYKTPQTLGKAVRRVQLALPVSPRKRKVVVTKLAYKHGVKKCCLMHLDSNRKIPKATKVCVESFFQLDSISRQAPGIRDFVVIRTENQREKCQKRHLLWSLKETYSLFTKSQPTIKLSFSKFCSLRPPNVLLSSKMPRNVCLCEKHDNIKLLCQAIHNVVPEVPLYSSDTLHTFVCDSGNEKCMTSKCNKCPKWMAKAKTSASLDDEMSWHQWERVVLKLPNKKGKPLKTKKKIQKVVKEGTVEDAINALGKKMPAFLEHVFIKRKQSQFFEEKISDLQPNEAAIQIDFSENYRCSYQDEIQAAHWDQSQVTIFPVVVWTMNGSETSAYVTDDKNHDKQSVSVFLDKVLSRISKEHPGVKVVHIFSDGPSSQFKNKYMVQLIKRLQQQNGLFLRWHYFASSHGKGAVDGVGATVKRSVWNAVNTRKVSMVNDAKSFTTTANDVCNLSIDVVLVTKKEILNKYPSYGLQKARQIPGISKVHSIESDENGTIILKKYSTQDNEQSIHEITYSDEDSYVESNEESGDSDVERGHDSDVESGDSDVESDDSDVESGDSDVESGDSDVESGDSDVESGDSDVESGDSDVESGDGDVESGDSDVESGDSDVESDDSDVESGDSDVESGDSDVESGKTDDKSEDELYDLEITCDKNKDNKTQPCEQSNKSNVDLEVNFKLPKEIADKLSSTVTYSLPQYKRPIVEAILSNNYAFEGRNLIDLKDLKELSGRAAKDRDKWLSNFVIDGYLEIVSNHSSLAVKSVGWEKFERCSVDDLAKELVDLDNYDLVLVPCNEASTEHWFLVALFPKHRCIAVFDSLAESGKLKPKVKRTLEKCAHLVHVLGPANKWNFYCGQAPEVLQQRNGFDCGIFVCMYARALALGDPLITPCSVPDFRLGMIVELHEQMLTQFSATQLEREAYYAVDYGKKYFIGRLLSIEAGLLKFKFLHSMQYKGCNSFYWPNRADYDTVHPSRLVYGPLQMHLDERHCFTVKNIDLDQLFSFYRKKA